MKPIKSLNSICPSYKVIESLYELFEASKCQLCICQWRDKKLRFHQKYLHLVNESLMMTNDEWLRTEFNDLARTDVCPLVALFSHVSLSHSLDLSAVTPWARLLHKHHDWYPCVASQQTHSPLFRVVKACTIQSRGPHKHCNIMFSHTALIQNPFQSITLLKLAWGFCVLGGYSTQAPFRPAETHVSKPLQPADRGSVWFCGDQETWQGESKFISHVELGWVGPDRAGSQSALPDIWFIYTMGKPRDGVKETWAVEERKRKSTCTLKIAELF